MIRTNLLVCACVVAPVVSAKRITVIPNVIVYIPKNGDMPFVIDEIIVVKSVVGGILKPDSAKVVLYIIPKDSVKVRIIT
ncbi:MAG: hypothetical protein QXI91_01430 [Candidatus Bathyarchaeia archaeon]